MRYVLPVYWQMYAQMVVEAPSLEEAIREAHEMPNPEGDYVEGSFEIDLDVLEEHMPKEEVDRYRERLKRKEKEDAREGGG